jgi:hypothetical protein
MGGKLFTGLLSVTAESANDYVVLHLLYHLDDFSVSEESLYFTLHEVCGDQGNAIGENPYAEDDEA